MSNKWNVLGRATCWLGIVVCLGAVSRHVAGGEVAKAEIAKPDLAVIYAADGKQVLFNLKRTERRSGSKLDVQRDYTYPDGRLAAREHAVYEGDALVSFELDERQIGASGSAKLRRTPGNPGKGNIEFAYSSEPGARVKISTEALRDNTIVNETTGPFLAAHWETLWRGEAVKCRYIVVPRRETVGFTFVRDKISTWKGRKVLIVRMDATSPFIKALVDPLFFTVDAAPPHLVLQYAGRVTPKVNVGGKWKDLDGVTIFDWESAR